MHILKKFIFTLIFVLSLNLLVSSQGPPPPAGSPGLKEVEKTFTSVEGGFKIEIPNRIMGFSGLRPNEINNLGAGGLYMFRQPEANYRIGYIDFSDKFSDSEIKALLKTLHENILNFSLSNIKSSEVKVKDKTIINVIGESAKKYYTRYILSDRSITVLMAELDSRGSDQEKSLAKVEKVFDSIEFFSGEKLIAEKLEAATPKALPQSPSISRKISDAQEDNLKEKVKTVLEYSEDLTGTWYSTGKKADSEIHFDEAGNTLKKINYNYRGLPMSVTIYGFIDGKRVSDFASIDYAFNPPPAAAPPGAATSKPKKKDDRYDSSYIYKYDEKNRLIEKQNFNNSGEFNGKSVYEYDGNKVTRQYINKKGDVTSKTIEIYDGNGHLIERTYDSSTPEYPPSIYNYEYVSFDKNGNWTKRIIKGKSGQYGGKYKDSNYIEYRTISYYQ